jgi:hypothetical protein
VHARACACGLSVSPRAPPFVALFYLLFYSIPGFVNLNVDVNCALGILTHIVLVLVPVDSEKVMGKLYIFDKF